MEENESESDQEISIIEILQKLVPEERIRLLDGENPEAASRMSISLNFWLAVSQLIIADVSIFFTLAATSFDSSLAIFNDIILFLVIFTLIFGLLLFGLTRWYGRRISKNLSSLFHEFTASKCLTCNSDSSYSIDERKALFHKIEDPRHHIDFLKIEVRVSRVYRHVELFSFIEVFFIIFLSLLFLLYLRIYFPQLAFLSLVTLALIPVIGLTRLAIRALMKSNYVLIEVREDRSVLKSKSTIFFKLMPNLVNKKFLKRQKLNLERFPAIIEGNNIKAWLVSNFDENFFGKVTVVPYSKIHPGLYSIFF